MVAKKAERVDFLFHGMPMLRDFIYLVNGTK